ncbi:MAG TPA: glycine zipper 2TM domain-containing protein [Rhodanobacter sp.]|nr:glycine zipper 2TM domain-containing protein [Rhodanobacter sp.]
MVKLWVSVLALALLAGSAQAQDAQLPNSQLPNGQLSNTDGSAHFGWADVLRADPVHGVTRTNVPRQECYDQQVVRHEGGNTTAGTVLGAVIGGVLGNTVGKGDGRKAATVVGAVAGGAVGNRASRGQDYETTQTQCRDVNTVSEQRRIIGYDVEYRYRGEVYMSRLDYDPGERLRVRVSVTPVD